MKRSKIHKEIETWLGKLPRDSRRLFFFPCLWDLEEPEHGVVWFDEKGIVVGGSSLYLENFRQNLGNGHVFFGLAWRTTTPPGPGKVRYAYAYAEDLGPKNMVAVLSPPLDGGIPVNIKHPYNEHYRPQVIVE